MSCVAKRSSQMSAAVTGLRRRLAGWSHRPSYLVAMAVDRRLASSRTISRTAALEDDSSEHAAGRGIRPRRGNGRRRGDRHPSRRPSVSRSTGFPNPDHVALYYGLDNGFYDEQNLTVEFETPSDVTAGLKLVATNDFDLSIFYEGDMFLAAPEGLPVIAVGALIPTPLNSLMAPADSKVQGPDTIKGATIGVAGFPSTTRSCARFARSRVWPKETSRASTSASISFRRSLLGKQTPPSAPTSTSRASTSSRRPASRRRSSSSRTSACRTTTSCSSLRTQSGSRAIRPTRTPSGGSSPPWSRLLRRLRPTRPDRSRS